MLGVPVMTKKSLMATRKALGEYCRESFEKSMKEAAEEEKRMTIERGVIQARTQLRDWRGSSALEVELFICILI